MKKIFIVVSVLLVLSNKLFAQNLFAQSNASKIADTQKKIEKSAFTQYPVPITSNFLERKLIYDWTKRWNEPDIVCYTYIFIGSTCIGYFITHGKPVSTQSYLLPEHLAIGIGNSDLDSKRETPDVDGTYGKNNPGYRFFLANGTAVECSGTMVSCVYSDAPLSLSAVEIKSVKSK